jgi:hypothetical protein
MRPTRYILLMAVPTLIGWPTQSWAAIELRASYSYGGQAVATPNTGNFQGALTDVKFDGATAEVQKDDVFGSAFGVQGFATATGNVFAEAHFGWLQAGFAMNLHAENLDPAAFGTNTARVNLTAASATARWRDTALVTAPSVPTGVVLTATAIIKLDGNLSASAAAAGCCARGEARVAIRDLAGFQLPNSGSDVDTVPAQITDGTTLPAGQFQVVFPFVTGISRDFGFELNVSLAGYANRGNLNIGYPLSIQPGASESHMLSDYTHTLTWGGISSVAVAATGEPVADWTIVSESGFDYSRPFVPEPASSVLLTFVLCAWLLQTRRRRQQC